jgi:hypothetical protein
MIGTYALASEYSSVNVLNTIEQLFKEQGWRYDVVFNAEKGQHVVTTAWIQRISNTDAFFNFLNIFSDTAEKEPSYSFIQYHAVIADDSYYLGAATTPDPLKDKSAVQVYPDSEDWLYLKELSQAINTAAGIRHYDLNTVRLP